MSEASVAELHQKIDQLLDDPSRRRWLRVPQAAEHGSLSEETIRRLLSSGKLTAHRPVKGVVVIDRLELDALIASSTATPRIGRGKHQR